MVDQHAPSLPTGLADLVAGLTLDEKVRLLSGHDTWRTAAIERIGLGAVKTTDGPNGARGDSTSGATAICLPASIGLGASFDRSLVAEVGALLGRETARKGAHVLLAPTINLARHPLGGRNFESFGEDPMLTAGLAVAYIEGVQSEGVAACAKHFVANDVEYARMTVSSEVDEATLREVYLLPFEAAVEAGVWSIMASYPKLNGQHCTEHHWLLTDLLRDEWGFDGLVMSDWGATHHRSRPVVAGLDLEMPGPPVALGPALRAAVDEGEVAADTLDARVGRVLQLAQRTGRLDDFDEDPEQSLELDEDRALARRAAAAGMVLLTNDGTLPLAADAVTSVAVIGPNAVEPVIQGGGSAQVPTHRVVTPADGLAAALGADRVTTHQGCLAHRYLPVVPPSTWVRPTSGDGGSGSPAEAGRPIAHSTFDDDAFAGDPIEVRDRRTIGAFIHGPRPATNAAERFVGHLPIAVGGRHTFGVLAVGRSRVLVDGQLVADNWTDPTPGDAFFQYGTREVTGEIELEAGKVAEVVVEWGHGDADGDDHGAPLRGLRVGHLPPIDEDALLTEAVEAAAAADVAVVVVGLTNEWETEGHDRARFELPGRQNELVSRVSAANPATVVVLNVGGPVEIPWADEPAAVLTMWYPGQELGHALADVVLGVAEPSGRLPLTWPTTLADTPFELPIPEPGPPPPGALLPYSEGTLIGHRSYDRRNVAPFAPFGFGLGYTTFELGTPVAEATSGSTGAGSAGPLGPGVRVRVPVRNAGERSGTCVVQVYVAAPDRLADDGSRPRRTLGGFEAVVVDAGATTEAIVAVPERTFARWDATSGAWAVDGGARQLLVGLSSADLPHIVEVELPD